jgi:prepilin-type N-terminal cleavage/methylation domain-containing protein
MRRRLIQDESGFTLPEMLVSMTMMVVVLFALYSIFDMSLRVFSFGNDKVEAVENARLGLEKMEREIRAAYPVNGPTGTPRFRFFSANGASPPTAAAMPTASQITFGNELGSPGDKAIRCPSVGTCEYITYKLTDDASGAACTVAPCTLRRVNTANSTDTGQPVVEFVEPGGLTFSYLKSDGTTASSESQIARVRITLQIRVEGGQQDGTQDLTTEVNLRNPGVAP